MEDLVAETLHERALDIEGSAPPVVDMRRTGWPRLPALLAGVAAAALVVIGFAVVKANIDGDESTQAASKFPDIRGLTGRAVGEALGLEPTTWPVPGGCYAFSVYDDPWGFCFEHLVFGPQASHLLGRQIGGDTLTDVEADYLAAVLELKAMADSTIANDPDREAELRALVDQLGGQIPIPQPSVDGELPRAVSQRAQALLGDRFVDVSVGQDQASYILGVLHLAPAEVAQLTTELQDKVPLYFEPRNVTASDTEELRKEVEQLVIQNTLHFRGLGDSLRDGRVVVGVAESQIPNTAATFATLLPGRNIVTTTDNGSNLVCPSGGESSSPCVIVQQMGLGEQSGDQ